MLSLRFGEQDVKKVKEGGGAIVLLSFLISRGAGPVPEGIVWSVIARLPWREGACLETVAGWFYYPAKNSEISLLISR